MAVCSVLHSMLLPLRAKCNLLQRSMNAHAHWNCTKMISLQGPCSADISGSSVRGGSVGGVTKYRNSPDICGIPVWQLPGTSVISSSLIEWLWMRKCGSGCSLSRQPQSGKANNGEIVSLASGMIGIVVLYFDELVVCALSKQLKMLEMASKENIWMQLV